MQPTGDLILTSGIMTLSVEKYIVMTENLGDLLESLQEGDCLIVTEVSRLSRTLIDIMNIINTCIQRKIVLHSTKEGYTFENNLNSKILGFAFGLVAEIERNLISIRTREALAVRKAEGKNWGARMAVVRS